MSVRLNAERVALSQIASGTLSAEQCKRLAHTVLTSPAETKERAKEQKDRARAMSAIRALEKFLANPDSTRLQAVAIETIHPEVMEGAKAELYRLGKALDRPAALKAIYRRNEK